MQLNLFFFEVFYYVLIGLGIFLVMIYIATRFKLKFFKRQTDELNVELKKTTEDLKIANEELMVLNAIGELGISTLDIDEILTKLITVTVDMTKFDTGRIYLYDKITNRFEIKASHGVADNIKEEELLLIDNFANKVVKCGKLTVTYEYSKPMFGVPLSIKDTIYGVALVEASEKYKFSSREIKMMELVADRISLAIDRAEAYKKQKRLADELSIITHVSSVISATLDIDRLYELITKTAVEIMEADVSTLRLLDNDKEELDLKSIYGLKEEYIFKGVVKIGKSIVGRVVKNKIPIIVSNLQTDSRYDYPELAEKTGLKSLLSIPLIVKSNVLGALSIYTKEERNFDEIDIKALSAFTNHASIAIENATLFASIKDMYFSTIKAFAEALSARDTYTRGHSETVAKYAKRIAEEMNLSDKDVEIIEYGAILHDIGKIGIEDKILNKMSPLTDEEYEIIKGHPIIAGKILEPLDWFRELVPIITHHHERFDGSGYPSGLSKENIPLLARILLVVDSFEAMTSDRPYRKALPIKKAIDELRKHSGTQFDPQIVETFLDILAKNDI